MGESRRHKQYHQHALPPMWALSTALANSTGVPPVSLHGSSGCSFQIAWNWRSPFVDFDVNDDDLRSSSKRRCFASRPPAKPVSAPLLPITRWHGATMEMGLRPLAAPTARYAVGLPTARAMSA